MADYLVTARKWRPAFFDEIIGQTHVTRTLMNAVSSGKVAHAYLFSGPRGVGKTTAARILAKSLNCSALADGRPCNVCDSCASIAAGSSIDVLEIDGASNNGVENVRDLREGIRFLPTMGRFKVYIIDEVHMLSLAAFNALLKTLEEPPLHAVFVLATTEVHKIPLTIISRCQRFDFRRIRFKDIQLHLEKILKAENISYETGAVFSIAREADGSLRDGQSLLDQLVAFSGGALTEGQTNDALGLMDRTLLFDLMAAIGSKDGLGCLNIVEKMHNFGYDFKRCTLGLIELVRDMTVVKSGMDALALEVSESDFERLSSMASGLSLERLHMLYGVLSSGYEEVSRSAHPRYSFEMALLRAVHFDAASPIEELIERVERLRTRLPAEGSKAPLQRQTVRVEPLAPKPAPTTPVPDGVVDAAVPKAETRRNLGLAEEDTSAYGVKETAQASPVVKTEVKGLIDYIKAKDPSLASGMELAGVSLKGDALDITAPARVAGRLSAGKADIERFLKDYLKKTSVRVSVIAGADPGAGSGAGQDGRDVLVIADAERILGAKVIQ